jgi:hypothetical protein
MPPIRTTLSLDDDVLAYAREMAEHQGRTIGAVVSELARKGVKAANDSTAEAGEYRNGLRLFPTFPSGGGRPVTMELVNALRDEEY